MLLPRVSCLLALPCLVHSASLLLFTRTTDYRHVSIPTAIAAIQAMGASAGFTVVASEDPTLFSDAGLSNITAVAFVSNSEPAAGPPLLDSTQQAALERFYARGGGHVGIHAGNACLFSVAFYAQVTGALFDYHPDLQPATFTVINSNHPSTSGLPTRWTFTEEVYNYRSNPRQNNVTVIMSVDESSYTDPLRGTRPYDQGNPHPIAWYRDSSQPGLNLGNGTYAPGRAWYTSLGHTIETWQNQTFLGHIQGGITWVLAAQSSSPTPSVGGSSTPAASSSMSAPASTSARSGGARLISRWSGLVLASVLLLCV